MPTTTREREAAWRTYAARTTRRRYSRTPCILLQARLEEDANKLYALGEVDKEVLRRLVEGSGSVDPKRGDRLEEALRAMRSLVENASSARRAIERLRSGE